MTITEETAQRLLANKEWRMSHLYKIQTKRAHLQTLKPNLAQQDFARRRSLRTMCLKARQLGFSTYGLIDMFDDTITNKNISSAVIAHDSKKVQGLFEIVKRAYENMPREIRPRALYENRNELHFPDLDSKIYVTLDTRSGTTHNAHVSEVAFMRDAERKMAGILGSIPDNGKVVYESTANGMSGFFFDEWENEVSEFSKLFYNWMWDSDYTLPTEKTFEQLDDEYQSIAVRYRTIPDIRERFSLSEEQFAWYISMCNRHRELVVQEYPTTALEAFMSSGRNMFHIYDLNQHVTSPPAKRMWNDLMVWEPPIRGFHYVIGCDPAEGTGNDNSAVSVFNAHTGEQVAEYVSNAIKPDMLGHLIMEIGHFYNEALLVIEVNGHGRSVVDTVKRRYPNLYRREHFDKVSNSMTQSIGFKTTGVTKVTLVNTLEQMTRDQDIHIRSDALIKEMRTFVETDEVGKQGFGAEGSNKDDRVIAAALALQGFRWVPQLKLPETMLDVKLKEYAQKHGEVPEFFREAVKEEKKAIVDWNDRMKRYRSKQLN